MEHENVAQASGFFYFFCNSGLQVVVGYSQLQGTPMMLLAQHAPSLCNAVIVLGCRRCPSCHAVQHCFFFFLLFLFPTSLIRIWLSHDSFITVWSVSFFFPLKSLICNMMTMAALSCHICTHVQLGHPSHKLPSCLVLFILSHFMEAEGGDGCHLVL